MKTAFHACEDGLTNELVISEAKSGPHYAYVRALPSGIGLAHLTWVHDDEVAHKVPAEVGEILVVVDDGPELRLDVEPLKAKGRKKAKVDG